MVIPSPFLHLLFKNTDHALTLFSHFLSSYYTLSAAPSLSPSTTCYCHLLVVLRFSWLLVVWRLTFISSSFTLFSLRMGWASQHKKFFFFTPSPPTIWYTCLHFSSKKHTLLYVFLLNRLSLSHRKFCFTKPLSSFLLFFPSHLHVNGSIYFTFSSSHLSLYFFHFCNPHLTQKIVLSLFRFLHFLPPHPFMHTWTEKHFSSLDDGDNPSNSRTCVFPGIEFWREERRLFWPASQSTAQENCCENRLHPVANQSGTGCQVRKLLYPTDAIILCARVTHSFIFLPPKCRYLDLTQTVWSHDVVLASVWHMKHIGTGCWRWKQLTRLTR